MGQVDDHSLISSVKGVGWRGGGGGGGGWRGGRGGCSLILLQH